MAKGVCIGADGAEIISSLIVGAREREREREEKVEKESYQTKVRHCCGAWANM